MDVLLFASLKDEIGPKLSLDLPEGTDVGGLRRALETRHAAFARMGWRTLVAVNETYATDSEPLRTGDVVAVLPPVAGG